VVTDREKVESIVYDLADAIRKSDVERIMGHMDVDGDQRHASTVEVLGLRLKETATRLLMQRNLDAFAFDVVRISSLNTQVQPLAREAEASFRVFSAASAQAPGARRPRGARVAQFGAGSSDSERPSPGPGK
jgi:hypothetical protein